MINVDAWMLRPTLFYAETEMLRPIGRWREASFWLSHESDGVPFVRPIYNMMGFTLFRLEWSGQTHAYYLARPMRGL